MLIVLAIISILILLFVPNLIKEKSQVQKTGEAAVVKVVESQAQLYELDHDDEKPSLAGSTFYFCETLLFSFRQIYLFLYRPYRTFRSFIYVL